MAKEVEEARLGEMKLGLLEFAVFRDAHAPAAARGGAYIRVEGTAEAPCKWSCRR